VRESLARFWGEAPGLDLPGDVTTRISVSCLVRALRRQEPIASLARRIGASRLTLSRWLEGEAEPRLPDLLRMVDATTQRLLDFVAVFVDPGTLRSTRAAWSDLQAQLRVAYDLPWSHAVLRVLELEEYAALPEHVPGFITRCLGIEREQEELCLQALLRAKQIRKARGRFVPTRVLPVDTRGDARRNRALKAHWAEVALDRLRSVGTAAGDEDLFSYSLVGVSAADYERIRELHAGYFEQLRAIVRASTPTQVVLLVNTQLVTLSARVGRRQAARSNARAASQLTAPRSRRAFRS